MAIYLAGVVTALVLLALGEQLPNETKKEYVKQGYSWRKVLLYSNISAIIGGLLSTATITLTKMPSDFNPQLLPFATTITAYITTQSLMTDLKTFLINRNILRVAYLSMYVISIYNVFTNEMFAYNKTALLLFTVLLVLLFIFSSIGASDVRAIAVALPFVISMGGYTAILMFVITLLVIALYMTIKKHLRERREKSKKHKEVNYNVLDKIEGLLIRSKTLGKSNNQSEEHPMAVGPFMVMPFLAFLLVYPLLV